MPPAKPHANNCIRSTRTHSITGKGAPMTTRFGMRGARVLLALAVAVATTIGPAAAQTVPAMPAPVAVTLTPASTALLVMDVIAPICNAQQPNCLAMVPRVAALIAAARKAGVWVLYSAAAPAGLV